MPVSIVILSVYMCCFTISVQISCLNGYNAATPTSLVSPFMVFCVSIKLNRLS